MNKISLSCIATCIVASIAVFAAVTACGKKDSKADKNTSTTANAKADDVKNVPGDYRTKPRNVSPFKAEYGPRFLAFMNELSPVVTANAGKCEAMAASVEPIVGKHAATITLMRDSSSPAARKWRATNGATVSKFRAAMKHMLACGKNAKVRALFVRMRRPRSN